MVIFHSYVSLPEGKSNKNPHQKWRFYVGKNIGKKGPKIPRIEGFIEALPKISRNGMEMVSSQVKHWKLTSQKWSFRGIF